MIPRQCIECGRLVYGGSRCPLHPSRWGGSTRAWRTQRRRILDRDGHRCTYVTDAGRCPATTLLEVHHVFRGVELNVPDHQLVTRCRKHNPRGG